jgi:hypothetical protein
MYFIAAETTNDRSEAIAYLDTVRFHRGLQNLPSSAVVKDEVTKAYRKEFYGEGQIFFYYKRRDFSQIPSGRSSGNISMDKSKYVVPLPESETNFQNQ